MNLAIVDKPRGKIYKCCVCKREDVWTDSWRWFGSYKQLDDQGIEGVKPILYFCSDDCAKQRAKHSKTLQVAMEDGGVYG